MLQLSLLMTSQYRLISVAAILDVFETANRFAAASGGQSPFEINLLCTEESMQDLPAGMMGHTLQLLNNAGRQDLILIPAFRSDDLQKNLAENNSCIPWLQQQFKAGAAIASFCTGAFLLGATGLLKGRPATTHVDACSAFASVFPDVHLQPDKIVTGDSGLYTSGGATSGFHLMLHLLQLHCGKEMAVRIAKHFAIDMDRGHQSYFSTFQPAQIHDDELVALAQQKIDAAYMQSHTIEEMIKDIPASRRNIVRRFKQATGITPIEYLQKTRMEAAKGLLERTNQQMTEIMLNSGYSDPKAFRKIFRKTVGMTPSGYREKFQGSY